MLKKIIFITIAIVVVSLIVLLNQKNKTPEKLIQISTADSGKWVGFAPFYLAKVKGFDKKYGTKLKIEKVGNSDARRQMLASGQVDFLTPTIDGAVFNINAGMDVKVIMAYDTSYGGDGIVAKNDIKTFSDLKGKTVAATKGFTNYFFLKYLMNKNGLKNEDLNIIDLQDDAIGPAFLAGKIDAGAMMEPWISNVVTQGKGHLLVSSKDTPNVITDIVLARSESIKNKENGLVGIARAWFDAVEYWDKNRDESNEVMAKEYGMTKDEFVKAIESVRWLNKNDNFDYFGSQDRQGQVFEIAKSIITVAEEEKIISKKISAQEIIDFSILDKLK
jgi:NitT/TauT family transport system substrate-binding protein